MKVRYYADAELDHWHKHILRLLETIHDEHDIPVEIDRVEERHGPITEFPGDIRYPTTKDVYDRDLKDNHELAATIDRAPASVYKLGDEFDIAGHVAIIDDQVQWASTLHGDAYGHGPGAKDQTPIDFLADMAESPSNRVCVECLHQLDGDETFCPNCGRELP